MRTENGITPEEVHVAVKKRNGRNAVATRRNRSNGKAGRSEEGRQTAREHQQLQQQAESKRQKSSGSESSKKKAVQAGSRPHPEPPLPEQHLEKPGIESELKPRPQYKAPEYRGSGKLDGKVAVITGGDSGIGRAVAVLFAREGADVAIVYLDEHGDAEETRGAVEAEGRRAVLIPGDVTDPEFCRQAVETAMQELGHLDVLVNNAAFQEHASSLEDISPEQLDRTFRTNIFG
jgi:hypothetical protein